MIKQDQGVAVSPHVRQQLTEYYLTAEASLGLRSSFGSLVDAALGGWQSGGDHERAVMNRHQLGPSASTQVSRARTVRRCLLSIGARHEGALGAVFGQNDWPRLIDRAFGTGVGLRCAKQLGDLLGVALLTNAVRDGFARERAQEHKPVPPRAPGQRKGRAVSGRAWDTPGGWLVSCCLQRDKRLDVVRVEADWLLRAALSAYGDAVGVDAIVRAEPQVRYVRQPRYARHIDPVRAGES